MTVQYYFETNVFIIYLCIQTYFHTDHHCKIQSELSDLLEKSTIEYSSRGVLWRSALHCYIQIDSGSDARIV